MQFIDLTGARFGRLTAVRYLGKSRWQCLCDCGADHQADAYHLRSGKIVSCGCQGRENRRLAVERWASETLAERFWKLVDKSAECWLWKGSRYEAGYGRLTFRYENMQAHRVSYELAFGVAPGEMLVCHRCDNPPCVRPDHLFLGTAKDNTQDAIAKGRMAIGSANPRAKLIETQVAAIRRQGGSVPALAVDYGVSERTIVGILEGETWRHVEV